LPFANMSGDATQDYFVDGVVDDIISALSRVRAFFVIARTSSFTYKGRTVDIKQVGRELGVRYVLEGSFRKAGDRVRIAVELIEADSGRQMWNGRFEGKLDDIFELQDGIAAGVVGAIEPTLRLAEAERARAKPTANLGAYDLCLRAQPDMFSVSTKAANDEAIALLYRAIEMDPDYSYAKAACALAYAFRKAQNWISDFETQKGISLAKAALADHRDDPGTLTYAAQALSYLGFEHDNALRAIDRALALNPNSTMSLKCAGWIRCYAGEGATAIKHFEDAMRLNPLDPEMGHMLSGLGLAYLVAGKFEDALQVGLKSLQDTPTWVAAHQLKAVALVQLERIDEAKLAAQCLMQLAPTMTLAGRWKEMPYRDQAFKTRYLDALRIAGVPE
jgi:adenylate cyclase